VVGFFPALALLFCWAGPSICILTRWVYAYLSLLLGQFRGPGAWYGAMLWLRNPTCASMQALMRYAAIIVGIVSSFRHQQFLFASGSAWGETNYVS